MIWKKRVEGFVDPEIIVVGGFHGFFWAQIFNFASDNNSESTTGF